MMPEAPSYVFPHSAAEMRKIQERTARRLADSYLKHRDFYLVEGNIPNVEVEPPSQRLERYLTMDREQWEAIAAISLRQAEDKVLDFARLLRRRRQQDPSFLESIAAAAPTGESAATPAGNAAAPPAGESAAAPASPGALAPGLSSSVPPPAAPPGTAAAPPAAPIDGAPI